MERGLGTSKPEKTSHFLTFFLPICHCGSAYSKLILLCMRSNASFWTVPEQCTPRHRSRRLLRVESSPWNLTSTSISSGSGSFYRVIVSFLATVARFCAVQICFGFVRIHKKLCRATMNPIIWWGFWGKYGEDFDGEDFWKVWTMVRILGNPHHLWWGF